MSRSSQPLEEREPYFSVLSSDEYRAGRITNAARLAFFATGEAYVAAIFNAIGGTVPLHMLNSALEYGCGPGRVAIPLARRVARVVAVDRSAAMLELAQRHAADWNVPDISFVRDTDLDSEERFALVNCSLLLQRMPSIEGLPLIRMLLRRVRNGGVIVLHFPYRNRAGMALQAVRRLRAAAPPVNAVLNVIRRKRASEPFQPTHVYDLAEVRAVLRSEQFELFEQLVSTEGDVDSVVLIAQRDDGTAEPAPPAEGEERIADRIDVRRMIATKSIAELNATAERYFSSLENRDFHLAKPFSSISEAPPILINLAVLLQGLRLLPGHTVLDFGAGSGWLSRILTQLGCQAIVMDVSASALDISREAYRRSPVIGDRPAPRFLQFDGERIDLPDASVDRIVCFDAFHHAPNPEKVIGELGRILRPGGVAGFAEPGPYHSQTAQSQFEMRTYGVVENDVDIDAIWTAARNAGFADMRLAVFNIPPFEVHLPEFKDMLAGGEIARRWADATRASLHNVRDFFLVKDGAEPIDSRTAGALACRIASASLHGRTVDVTVENTGTAIWLPSSAGVGSVAVGCHLFDREGRLVRLDFTRAALAQAVAPAESVSVSIELPPLPADARVLEIDCVAEGIAWFSIQGSTTRRIELPHQAE